MGERVSGMIKAFGALLAIAVLLSLAAPARAAAPRRVVTAAVPASWPPQYSLDENGAPVGFAVDVMNEVAARAGLEVRYRVLESFPRTYSALAHGDVDLIPECGIVPERRAQLAFTSPIDTFVLRIFVRSGTTGIDKLDDLAGHRVAVVETNVAVSLLKARPKIKLRVFSNVHAAMFDLLAGNVDALVFPQPIIEKLARDIGVQDRIRATGPPLLEVKRGIAVRAGDSELLSKLEPAVRSFVGSPAYKRLYVKWYGQPTPFWTVPRVLWTMGALLVVVMISMGVWRYATVVSLNRRLVATIEEREHTSIALREREAELRQAQKMEAVGRLAGGVAHDFNNLLTAITGYSELLFSQLPEGSQLREDVDEIRKASERAGNLTRQLLAFSRKQVLQPRVIDLGEIVANVEKMLRRLIGADIELTTHFGADPARVKADPGQIEQVIMNLAVNARDAMPEGGTLGIDVGSVEITSDDARDTLEPGKYVLLEVYDTGEGMDEATRQRIFEPFFTTKPADKGTGLGLATVYGIVAQSGGHVEVESSPGKGTRFLIYLPRWEGDQVEARIPPSEPSRAAEHATILLAEDETAVRQLAARMLRERGYDVLEAPTGSEALELAKRRGIEHIDLLLTDVIMPRMSGAELTRELRALKPDLGVLFVSGYPHGQPMESLINETGGGFIGKPFTADELERAVRSALRRERDAEKSA